MNLKTKQWIDTFIGMPLVHINRLLAKLLGKILNRNHSVQNTPDEICIIKLLGFGSVIIASDAIFSIKQKYPQSKLSIVCSQGLADGVESLNLFDKIYVIQDISLFQTFTSSIKIISNLQRVKKLWTIDLEVYSKLTSIFSLWMLAQNRFGFYFNQVTFRNNLNTHNIYFNTVIHVEQNYWRMANALDAEKLEKFIIPNFIKRNYHEGLQTIAINNTCSDLSLERKLTEKQLYDICEWILQKTSFKIVLLGAPSDKQTMQDYTEKYFPRNNRIENIAGKYAFRDYYTYLYNNCLLMITIDSAPLHIANKLNLPNLSIWGPTRPANLIDTDTDNEYIYLHASCSPCVHQTDELPCGGDNFCIKNITLLEITSKLQNLFEKTKASNFTN